MPTIEERVSYLEGKVDEHSRGVGELRELVVHLDSKVDRFREELSGRIDALDQKLTGRIDALDQKVDRFREELSRRIDGLDQKVSRQFVWLVGFQFAVLLAVIAAFLRG